MQFGECSPVLWYSKEEDIPNMSKKLLNLWILAALVLALLPAAALAAPLTQEGGKTYTIQKDDWLSNIADKEYGDPLVYQAIV